MSNLSLPIKKHYIQEQHSDKSPAHVGKLKHAVDFICAEGTEVYAVADGEVVWVKDDSNQGGWDKKYYYLGNRVVIKHTDGKYSAYEHLKYKGATVNVRDKIKTGQLIGYSGNTGYSKRPHLHFELFINPTKDESEGETIQVTFKE